MKKRIGCLLAALLLMMPAATYAQTYTTDGSVAVPVTLGDPIHVTPTYDVAITSALALIWQEGNTYSGTYQVGVKGVLEDDQVITVMPNSTSFSVTGEAGSKTGTIIQSGSKWAMDGDAVGGLSILPDEYSYYSGTATIEIPGEATYAGSVGFTFRIDRQ